MLLYELCLSVYPIMSLLLNSSARYNFFRNYEANMPLKITKSGRKCHILPLSPTKQN